MQFSYELLILSHKHRLYLIHTAITGRLGETTSMRLHVLPSRGIVVEPSPIRSLAADYQFLVEAFRI